MDDHNGFNENIFTFNVGPSETSFIVHADIVSQHSRVLKVLTEGDFKESIEKHAKLPEVDPETFRTFLAYAYSRSCNTSGDMAAIHTPATNSASISRIIELLLASGFTKFDCKCCYQTTDLKFSSGFPRCDKCFRNYRTDGRWRTGCVVNRCLSEHEHEQAGSAQGLLCGDHLGKLRNQCQGGNVLLLKLPRRLEEHQTFHFEIPLRAKDVQEAMKNPFVPFLESASLFDMAKLAIFADIYEVEPLAQAALLAFYRMLSQEVVDQESVAKVCKLVNTVYDNTPCSFTNDRTERTHVLRRMLIEFVEAHRDKFAASQTFKQLLYQGNDLAADLFSTTIQRGLRNA